MTATPTRLVLLALIAALAGCITEDTIRGALERTGERAVNDAADSSYDAARSKASKATEGSGEEGKKDDKAAPAEGEKPAANAAESK